MHSGFELANAKGRANSVLGPGSTMSVVSFIGQKRIDQGLIPLASPRAHRFEYFQKNVVETLCNSPRRVVGAHT